ncbi:DUF1254 domain-containing protein [Pseudomonas sp. AIG]
MEVTKRQFNKLFLVAAVAAFGRNTAMAETLVSNPQVPKTTSKEDLAFRAFRTSPAKSWDEQQVYQRGIEAVIWAMPAVSMAFFRDSAFKAYGITYHDVIAFSHPAQPRHELLTSNAQVPYVFTFFDLRDGPVVMDVPASNEQSLLYGQVVDAWQVSIADIGPSGADKGTGGKYLFTPPGWKGEVPSGYLHVPSLSYRLNMMLRSVKRGSATDADAEAYSHRLKVYPLSKADAPTTRFVDGFAKSWDSLPHYDMRFFQYIVDLLNVEPVRERDKVMMGMLYSLGIAPNLAFRPDARDTVILEQCVVDARAILESFFEDWGKAMSKFYPDRQWGYLAINPKHLEAFSYETDTTLYYDDRAGGMFYGATFLPKSLEGGGVFYLCSLRDSKGELFKGDRAYKMRVPKEVPAKDFWALVAYDLDSKSYIFNELDRGGLSSYDKAKMKLNEDGSVDLHLGAKAPAGLESNWIPTSGRDFFLFFRFYGPEQSVFDKSFVLPDVERLDA